MKMKILTGVVFGGALTGATPAIAQMPVSMPAVAPVAVEAFLADTQAAASAPAIAAPAPGGTTLRTLSEVELTEERGGEGLIVTNQTLTAITAGNVLNGDYIAGAVNISDNALSSFNGVGNLLINTGAQVSLQTGMNLTINVDGD